MPRLVLRSRAKQNNWLAAGTKLADYLRTRAEREGVDMQLSNEFFAVGLLAGCRLFFGIKVDDRGRIVRDAQEPEPNFLAQWKMTH